MHHFTRTRVRRVVGPVDGDGSGDRTMERGRRGTRLLAAGAAAAAAVALAGCGGGDSLDDLPTPSVPASLPDGARSGLPTALPTGLASLLPSGIPTGVPTSLPGVGTVDTATGADALKGTNVPSGFPVPPKATVEVGATAGSHSTVTMRGVDQDEVRTFYRQALPAAGYEITSDTEVRGIANTMAFKGHGVTGTIAAASLGSANTITVLFEKQ
ncbi:hypothetical protein Ga0074812_12152 [Parafrankia irregularis]|uniref:PT repeat-containing protein n=1 Tax=Parafrankia irregularis TaxID=795642 RepID=A0A0S4QTN6_9ACTN|nr:MULTISPECIES: hypothetical protein [Parafrankia]MBE3205098.1 hypothetical protein [Parafrankia sp. CH37]CUU58676.1 hypothetical protein Ga0074812_12152 [Parafrankia irregularis]